MAKRSVSSSSEPRQPNTRSRGTFEAASRLFSPVSMAVAPQHPPIRIDGVRDRKGRRKKERVQGSGFRVQIEEQRRTSNGQEESLQGLLLGDIFLGLRLVVVHC